MTFSNAAESASASSSASSARPSAAARTRPTRSASLRGPSLNLATIASSAAACAACNAPVAPPPGAAVRLAGLAEDLLPAANRNLITDLAAAAAAIGAAAITAQVNIEANLTGVKDEALADELAAVAELGDGVADRAGRLVTAVREEMSQ